MVDFDSPPGIPTDPRAPQPIEVPCIALDIGHIIGGRYEVRGRLGAGGMGFVFRVYDRDLSEDIALKVVSAKEVEDPAALARFRDEVKLARKITHKHVCKVFDYGEADGLRFLTMELIEGRNLRAVLRDGALRPMRVVEIVNQIAAGLSAVHANGMVHRDIKPENVVLRANGESVLVDFGLARNVAMDHRSEIVAGTPAYMSPEQLRGEALDARSDIFALGVLAYELLSGRSPFVRGSSAATANAILRDPPRPFESQSVPPNVTVSIEKVLNRAVSKVRSDRFASAVEFATALETAIGARPDLSPLPYGPAISRAVAGASVKRLRLLATAVALLLGIAGVAAISRRPAPTESPIAILVPFQNLTRDPSLDGLGSSATESVRMGLRRLQEIRVMEAKTDEEGRAALLENRANWILVGSVQVDSRGQRLVAQFEHAGKNGAMGEPIEVDLVGGKDAEAPLDQLKNRVLDEARSLHQQYDRYRRADEGTSNRAAKAMLIQYYDQRHLSTDPRKVPPHSFDAGKTMLDRALDADPEYVPALVERAFMYAGGAGGNVTPATLILARRDIDRAVAIESGNAPALIMRCRVIQVELLSNGSLTDEAVESAITACNDALLAAPASADVHRVFARLHDLRCDDQAAMTSLDRTRQEDRAQTGRVLAHLIELALKNRQFALADQYSRELIEFEEKQRKLGPRSLIERLGIPPTPDAPFWRAAVLLARGDSDEMKVGKLLEHIVDNRPDEVLEAVALRGLLHLSQLPSDAYERLATLEAKLETEIRTNPLRMIEVAGYYQWIDPLKAVEWIHVAEEDSGPSCDTAIRKASIYRVAGKIVEAREALDDCVCPMKWEEGCINWVKTGSSTTSR